MAAGGRVEHFNQKRVALGPETVERQLRERFTPPAAISAGAVAWRQSSHGTDVDVRGAAQYPTPPRPVQHGAAGNISRADYHIGAGGRGDQRREITRIVRQVRVHLTDHVDRTLQRQSDSIDVRPTEPRTLAAMHHLDSAR